MLFLCPTKRQTWVTYLTNLTTKSIQWTRPRITIKSDYQRHLTESQLIAFVEHIQVVERNDEVPENLDFAKRSLGELVGECITFIKNEARNSPLRLLELLELELKEIVRANEGSFIEQECKVNVHLTSNTLATQFSKELMRVRCVRKLTITLDWDVTRNDVQTFATAVKKVKVIRILVQRLPEYY
ncbi:hypothetical protein EDD21DRAFT_411190 [Dissophora ornata]|nr:hypothetical protein EDD21DRAFT_411190 [Dissophora ornata]